MNSRTWKQTDSRWSKKYYPTANSTVGGCGCGLLACTHIAMEQERYKDWTPENLRPWMVSKGFAEVGNGTKWEGITQTLLHIGHKEVLRVYNDPIQVAFDEFKKGNRLAILLFKKGNWGSNRICWTSCGHYIAVTDIKYENDDWWMYCKDSAGRDHTGWYSYRKHMMGGISKCWVVERVGNEAKSETTGRYTGELPTLELKKTNAQVIADTIAWAKWIASDNDFHYGYGKDSHHNGCYFCGTQPASKKKAGIKEYEHTYCCNPFVGAAWAHGGCVPEAIALCNKGKSWGFSKSEGYSKSKLFDHLGHPAMSKLKAGDVLCKDTHVALYIGDGRLVEAAGSDDNKVGSTKWINSISVKEMSASRYKGFPRVHRFNSSVSTSMALKHGEVSDRVKLWQAFLNWYFGKKVVAEDREFGDASLKWTKEFQKAVGLTADGIVGEATLKKAKEV